MKIIKYYLLSKYEKLLDYLVWKFNNPYKVNMPSGNCPIQSWGCLEKDILKPYYYFRARGSQWSLEISTKEMGDGYTDPGTDFFDNKTWEYREKNYQPWPECGYLSKRECIKLCTKALNKFYESKTTK